MRGPDQVCVLVHDAASTSLGAATEVARCLEAHYATTLVAPDLGMGVHPIYAGTYPYRTPRLPRLYRFPDFFWQIRKLAAAARADVIVSFKAYADTLPVALWEKRRRGTRVVAYLDEWDSAPFASLPVGEKIRRWICHAHHPLDSVYHALVERLLPRADAVICSSSFLARKFGARVIPLGVDTDLFRPQPLENSRALKNSLGLSSRRLVVFGGVARPHKGLEQVLDALTILGRSDTVLLIVGPETEFVRELASNPAWHDRLRCTGEISKPRMPEYLNVADVIVVPLADAPLSRSQVPCKVFEAMAMAKPVVATRVSDLPEILDGCGWIVSPGDAAALAACLGHILDHPKDARAMGEAARQKCLEKYTKRHAEKAWVQVVEEVWQKPCL